MKTRQEVEDLKAEWRSDPCWDIESTEGFEEYKEELIEFSDKCQKEADEIWAKRKQRLIKEANVFPLNNADIEVLAPYNGLTKRELFAAMAMQGCMNGYAGNSSLNVAVWSVECADALITELNKEE